MERGLIYKQTLVDTAAAIRKKTKDTISLYPTEFPTAIESIQTIDELFDKQIVNLVVKAERLPSYCLYRYTEIATLEIPNVTAIEQNVIGGNTKIKKLVCPKVVSVEDNGFAAAYGLETIDFYNTINLGNTAFASTKLSKLILRGPSVVGLTSTAVFNDTPIARGTGYIYVPQSLINSYKVTTNWLVFADQFRAIEDYPDEVNS